MEKIACSLFSIFRRNVDDAANSLRNARVMRDEAMQEVNDAIRNLKRSYQEGQTNMRVALTKLKEQILPNLLGINLVNLKERLVKLRRIIRLPWKRELLSKHTSRMLLSIYSLRTRPLTTSNAQRII